MGPTLGDGAKEAERELRSRIKSYPRYVANGQITQEDADRLIAVQKFNFKVLNWLSKIGVDEIKLALALVKLCRERPEILPEIAKNPDAVAAIKTLPDADIAALRQMTAEMQAKCQPKEKAA